MTEEPLSADPAAQRLPARILILEDSSFDADLARRLLTRAGLRFESVVVDTMDGFTRQLADFRPDVIVSDFQLQGWTGDQGLRAAREWRPDIPYIFWTGALGDETAAGLIRDGATDYVLKDRPARLPSAVSRALGEAWQRARIAEMETELGEARRLASMGHLRAAEQAAEHIRAELSATRSGTDMSRADGTTEGD